MNSNEVRDEWAERSGEFSPTYYAYYGPNETSELLRRLLGHFVAPDAAILELGCSSGRHLAHLHEHGFENVAGVEINDEAFEVMAESYPDIADAGTFYHDAIENAVTEFADDEFDVVYSVETLQHLHPDDDWVFSELARVTGGLLVTVENEGANGGASAAETEPVESTDADGTAATMKYINDDFPLYFRDWGRVFTGRGFVELDLESEGVDVDAVDRDAEALKRDTVRAFRPPSPTAE